MIIRPPNIIIKSLLELKNELNAFTDDPNIKNVIEIPNVKNNVFLNKAPFKNLPSFKPSILLFDSILKYIGNIGIIQGEKKDSNPSIKTFYTTI